MQKIFEIIKERKFKYINFFWIIISIQLVIGSNLQTKGYSINGLDELITSLIKIIYFSILFTAIHYFILNLISKLKERKMNNEKVHNEYKTNKYRWLIYFLIIIACWIPVLLAFYPGIVSYDGGYQIRDYYFSRTIGGQPILGTIIFTMFYSIGIELGSANLGILLFSLAQMSFMALVFSYAVKFAEDETKNKWIRNISILFYAIFPYNQLFPLITTKDVFFAGLVLAFIINIYKMVKEKSKIPDFIFLLIIGVIMLMAKRNSIYTLAVSLPFIALILIKDKRNLIKVVSLFLVIIVSYKIINPQLYKVEKISKNADGTTTTTTTTVTYTESALRLNLSTQAVAKVVKDKLNELTNEEKENISYYYNKDHKKIGEVYKPNIVDPASRMVNIIHINAHKNEFYEFIFKLGTKYPMTFLESFLNTTRGYWYIGDTSFNSIWSLEYPDTKGALEIFSFPIGKGKYMVTEDSKLPQLKQFYKNLFCKNEYQKIPILYIIFQPATYFYLTFAFLLYSVYKKEKSRLMISIILFTYFASCYLAYCSIIRYMYPVMVCAPIMIGLMFRKDREGEQK